jgi:hypothetical protein
MSTESIFAVLALALLFRWPKMAFSGLNQPRVMYIATLILKGNNQIASKCARAGKEVCEHRRVCMHAEAHSAQRLTRKQ